MTLSSRGAGTDALWTPFPPDPSLNAERLELSDNDVIYELESPARHVFMIEKGQVRTYGHGPNNSARLLNILGRGDWFGEASLARAERNGSRAVAVSATVVWRVAVDRLMDLLSRKPAAAAEMIRQLATRLQSAREDANRLVFDDCGARLVQTLLHFSQTAAATTADDGSVMLQITHRQLAQAVGAARETISLALTQLRQRNLLTTGRNRLTFRPDSLKQFIKDA